MIVSIFQDCKIVKLHACPNAGAGSVRRIKCSTNTKCHKVNPRPPFCTLFVGHMQRKRLQSDQKLRVQYKELEEKIQAETYNVKIRPRCHLLFIAPSQSAQVWFLLLQI